MQKAFLRVLQEHRFRPLGSSREIESDFRLVAATNRDLDQMVEGGRFRQDLLFRLKSFVIELPPLRERSGDIKELTRYHIDEFCERYGLAPKGFSPEFLDALKVHQWPGNIRELVNVLDRALAAARFEPTLFPKHLPMDIRVQMARASVNSKAPSDAGAEASPPQALPKLSEFREALYAQAEKHHRNDLVALCEGDIKEACRIACLSQSRLYALLQKHKILKRILSPPKVFWSCHGRDLERPEKYLRENGSGKGLSVNKSFALASGIWSALAAPQSQNPRRSPTTPAVLLNPRDQINLKSRRDP